MVAVSNMQTLKLIKVVYFQSLVILTWKDPRLILQLEYNFIFRLQLKKIGITSKAVPLAIE